jgi:hypothetical protein
MKTAVEWYCNEMESLRVNAEINNMDAYKFIIRRAEIFEQAKEMEKKQLFVASKTSAKEAYKAGQQTMHCGCYEISDALTYEEWLYETFKSE